MAMRLDSRVKAIEKQSPAPGHCRCSWLAVATLAELESLTTCPRCGKTLAGRRRKVYVGVSPDDWDGEA